MKVVKLILVVLALLFGFYLVFALLGPSSLQMQQSLTMHARAEAIYDEVNDLRKWEAWSPWVKMDTAMVSTYSDPSHGINAWVAWQSASLGNGKQVIVANEPYTRIRTQLNFEGWDGDSYSEWHFEETGDSTVVT
ncbi:MAG: SRPBCC family protein, partial [Bacteroidota bacterium]